MYWAPPCARPFMDIISSPPKLHALCTSHTAWCVVGLLNFESEHHGLINTTFISHNCFYAFTHSGVLSTDNVQLLVLWIIMYGDP